MRKLLLMFLTVVMVVAVAVPAAIAQEDEPFQLTILHTNDTHASHDPNSSGNGGVTRQAAVVEQIRAAVPNVLLMDAGDRFTGSLFHSYYKGQDQVQIMNLMGYDVMSLGNHEFDHGDETLAEFIQGADFPVVTANVEFAGSPLDGLVDPYTILDVNGEQIGVIGLLTVDTTHKSNPSDALVFSDDYAGIAQQYVDELTGQGINKIILLTHEGLGLDEIVAEQVTGVDIIVGGDSHTRLSNQYTGAEAGYPVVVNNPEGQPVYIVQADDQNEFMGRLNVTFDANGVVTGASGDLILLSQYIAPDDNMTALVEELRAPLADLLVQPVGETAVALDNEGSLCRFEECAIGNMIADAIRQETGAQIAVMNGGGIRASIDEGEITLGEVITVLPFGNLVSTFDLQGQYVWDMLENSVSRWNSPEGGTGRFLQVSGLRFTWDLNQEVGSRIVSVDVWNDATGAYEPLDLDGVYSVAANNFTRGGGDEYTMLAEHAIDPYDYGRPLDVVAADYIQANSPVAPELEGRITGLNLVR
ncbi:MAG TPA: 5'-nucleotidase C-terminal domain-containing protein [Aggregatilinea sp.]|uniref:bifunctional metallophosphatase/5'-nucleotidase n=1 Tax=Aggregatilinea sp. TaxID=2806333 RepID=UPI002B64D9F3|nr:5'-nucleotidase C-terminal domain-containing protein [Aggregatilinea sp.]HML23806.1 5'-nucleotidase C-terminal domain-containing protein [Aggregatilinea sp.]